MLKKEYMSTIWSAAPTPMTANGDVDEASIARLSEHHYEMGVRGVFIGGTSGEGPWLSNASRIKLAKATVKANAGRIGTAIQITDNSAERMIENMKMLVDTGVDAVVIAPPFFSCDPDQDYLYDMYAKVVDASPISVGLYHRGAAPSVAVFADTMAKVARLPKVVTIKDSACKPEDTRILLSARDEIQTQKEFYVYCGNEFAINDAAAAGYNGMTLGGGCFNAKWAKMIYDAAKAGKTAEAAELQNRLNNFMFDVFGGKSLHCWMAGQKQLMVELGVFSTNFTLLNYKLTPECAAAIKTAVQRDREFL